MWTRGQVSGSCVGALCPRHFKYETISVCHPERERRISLAGQRDPSLSLRMTNRDGLVFEMSWAQSPYTTTTHLAPCPHVARLHPSIAYKITLVGSSTRETLYKCSSCLLLFDVGHM